MAMRKMLKRLANKFIVDCHVRAVLKPPVHDKQMTLIQSVDAENNYHNHVVQRFQSLTDAIANELASDQPVSVVTRQSARKTFCTDDFAKWCIAEAHLNVRNWEHVATTDKWHAALERHEHSETATLWLVTRDSDRARQISGNVMHVVKPNDSTLVYTVLNSQRMHVNQVVVFGVETG